MSDKSHTATGLRRIRNACVYGWAGVRAAWREEAAFRQESVFILAALLLMAFGPLPWRQGWALLASALLVWVVELLNSAIEAVVDIASPGHHALAKKAKDCGSAAVGLSIGIMLLVWCALLLPLSAP